MGSCTGTEIIRDAWRPRPYLRRHFGAGCYWIFSPSTIFTGFRLENRFRLLKSEHLINPVLYVEYEGINEASQIKKEIVGNAENSPENNAELADSHAHEIEAKLILSSNWRDLKVSSRPWKVRTRSLMYWQMAAVGATQDLL